MLRKLTYILAVLGKLDDCANFAYCSYRKAGIIYIEQCSALVPSFATLHPLFDDKSEDSIRLNCIFASSIAVPLSDLRQWAFANETEDHQMLFDEKTACSDMCFPLSSGES